uniref:N-terminal EF-hand calcium binding protein 3 n=1 Tax=Pseudonaja textilis TaxID=8673 RepID=A0A670YJ49_PSETE
MKIELGRAMLAKAPWVGPSLFPGWPHRPDLSTPQAGFGLEVILFSFQKNIIIPRLYLNVDDGKLSFEEFKNCCADGILNSEDLWKLFNDIDRHHSGNLETEKLCDYFTEHLGEYRHVLSALEQLNTAVLSAMDKTKLVYESSSKMEQFVTRFLLRETMNQIQSLQVSLECAADTIEEQSGRER